jgi:hypothetical protein
VVIALVLIGHDETSGKNEILYYDTNFGRQASRIYETEVRNSVWRKWRNAKGFSQRFEGKINRAKSEIRGKWEHSEDRVHWNHDFDLTYRRLKN